MSEYCDIPFCEGYDPSTGKLVLRKATYFPDAVFDFAMDNPVNILDASGCYLHDLPDRFAQLDPRVAFFSNNLFSSSPPVLSECSNLGIVAFKHCGMREIPENALPSSIFWAIYTGNEIGRLPNSTGDLTHLRKLALAGNKLTVNGLPDSMQDCIGLELLRISANELAERPPGWVFELPRLAWFTDAGNPFSQGSASEVSLPEISWRDIVLGNIINESPSSAVYVATLKFSGTQVAVKQFKNGLASDGYAEDDMRSVIAAGVHDNLVKIIASVPDAPEEKPTLVFSLVPESYGKLGLPPTLDTCTRDVFPAGTELTVPNIVSVLTDVSAAATYLHERNIMHGDIYAHNILATPHGKALLCDFGAASLYSCSSYTTQRQAIDVRAFGCLIEDLAGQLKKEDATKHSEVVVALSNLQKDCTSEDVFGRPVFKAIYSTLSSITFE